MNYKIDGTPLSSFGAIPSPSSGCFALSGILDLPKRIGATEYDWGTEIEPFLDREDIELDGKALSLSVAIKKNKLQAFLNACVACTEVSFDYDMFRVVQKDEIKVLEVADYCKVAVPFWQNEVILKQVDIIPTGTGGYMIDNYNLVKDFSIHVSKMNDLKNVAKRIDSQTTEFYKKTEYRGLRTFEISCSMVGDDFAGIYDKMRQFQSILMSPGLRTLRVRNNTLSVYFKDGMKVDIPNKKIAKFNLRATVVV